MPDTKKEFVMNEEKVLGVNADIMLGINYFVPLIGIIAIIAEPHSSYRTRFHSLQAIFAMLIVGILAGATCGVLAILGVVPIVVGILMMTGKEVRIPGIAQLCDKLIHQAG